MSEELCAHCEHPHEDHLYDFLCSALVGDLDDDWTNCRCPGWKKEVGF